jgi:hypothetical protein
VAQEVLTPGYYRGILPDEGSCFSAELLFTNRGVVRALVAVGSGDPITLSRTGQVATGSDIVHLANARFS